MASQIEKWKKRKEKTEQLRGGAKKRTAQKQKTAPENSEEQQRIILEEELARLQAELKEGEELIAQAEAQSAADRERIKKIEEDERKRREAEKREFEAKQREIDEKIRRLKEEKSRLEEQQARPQPKPKPKQNKGPEQRGTQPKKQTTPPKKTNPTGEKQMTETKNWNEELKGDEIFKLAEKLGIDMSGFTADSEDSMKTKLEEIKKKIKEVENCPEGITLTPEEQKKFDEIKNEGKEPDDKARQSLEVNGQEPNTPKENENSDWVKQKREFYEKFAHEQNLDFKNDPQKDAENNSFSFSLEKDGKSLGEMTYTTPTSVQISKDSEIQMYQGVVKDALENNLSITFGQTLDDKQKAMLFAAVLMSDKKTYANGDAIELKNQPTIDVNAEYFKQLPENVQAVLKEHTEKAQQEAKAKEAEEKARKDEEAKRKAAEEKAQQEAAAQAKARQEAIQKKLQEMRAKVEDKAKALGKDKKDLTDEEYRSAYREALTDGLTDEQKQARQQKLDDREKMLAARLGIIPAFAVKDKDGNLKTIGEDAATKDIIQRVNPDHFAALQTKYGKGKE